MTHVQKTNYGFLATVDIDSGRWNFEFVKNEKHDSYEIGNPSEGPLWASTTQNTKARAVAYKAMLLAGNPVLLPLIRTAA